MSQDNIIPFPSIRRDAIDDDTWRSLQAEFYLDCYWAHHGHAPEGPDQLGAWLRELQLFADMENPFFRGWLMRRLNEDEDEA